MTVPNQTLVQILTATIDDLNKISFYQDSKPQIIKIMQAAKNKLNFMEDQLQSEQVHHIANFLKEQALLLNVDRQLLSYVNSAAFRILHTLEAPKPTHISIKGSKVNGIPIPDIKATQTHDNTIYNAQADRELDLHYRRNEQSEMHRKSQLKVLDELNKQRRKMSQPAQEKSEENTSEKKSSDLKLEL